MRLNWENCYNASLMGGGGGGERAANTQIDRRFMSLKTF